MKFQLTNYQTEAVADVITALDDAYVRFDRHRRLSAVALSAPTGAGKTVIATAVIERLIYGNETTEPNPGLSVLWVTDDPSLNIQTQRKMLMSSSRIRPDQLVVVDQSFDQRVLSPGKVTFVHIQQLGRGATNYTRVGNRRQFSLWDTIGATIAKQGKNFLLIVDEAHRGTKTKPGGARTITARLMDGAGGELPPAPVVLGISATPRRFSDAITKIGQRTLDPVAVDPEAVRESGLIKDKLRIKHPKESQPADSTLLELAVEDLRDYDSLWVKYSEEQREPIVRPVLVIQVKPKISDREIGTILATLKSCWSNLDGSAIGHSFQEHSTLKVGSRTIRYVAPQDIQDDPHLRVVLFKEALTTGWDCPRAEVMISLRPAQDHTYIAQLIGRMVRTPLARRIATDEVLNSVALYLPYFDGAQVQEVVSNLQSDESQITSEIELDSIVCPRNTRVSKQVWNVLAKVPTYTRPGKYHRNDVARLNALAALLVGSGLDAAAIRTARKHLVDTLAREATRLGRDLDKQVDNLMMLEYETQSVDLASGVVTTEGGQTSVNTTNLDDLFRRATRSLGDAAAKWYWDELCTQGCDPDRAKAVVAVVASDSSVSQSVETAASGLIDTWRRQHNGAISELPDAKRAQFYMIWQQAKRPEQVSLVMPSQITTRDCGIKFPKHLYVKSGTYPTKLTGWEGDVLKRELAASSCVAWYRNPTNGPAALAVPYDQSGQQKTMYPDFLFFHKKSGSIVVDIVDPHRPDKADTGPKWVGLAKYARQHAGVFRRVLAVVKDGHGTLLSLDLKNPTVLDELSKAANETDIVRVFQKFGGNY